MEIRDRDILKCLPFFLSSAALRWYEAKEYAFTTWESFEIAFRKRFCAHDEHMIMRDNIARRLHRELVSEYFESIAAMMRRLEKPMAREDHIVYAYRNLLPAIQLAIPEDRFYDLEELEDAARRAERKIEIAGRHRPAQAACPRGGGDTPRRRRPSVRREIATFDIDQERLNAPEYLCPAKNERKLERPREEWREEKAAPVIANLPRGGRANRYPVKFEEKTEEASPVTPSDQNYRDFENQIRELREQVAELSRKQSAVVRVGEVEGAMSDRVREGKHPAGKEAARAIRTNVPTWKMQSPNTCWTVRE